MENLTRERALELHRQMWTDMQKDLGDEPSKTQRCNYKRRWIKNHFPELADKANKNDDCEIIHNNCFLCEYADAIYGLCECPIDWPQGRCEDGGYENADNWQYMPISKLLALPEREEEEEDWQ